MRPLRTGWLQGWDILTVSMVAAFCHVEWVMGEDTSNTTTPTVSPTTQPTVQGPLVTERASGLRYFDIVTGTGESPVFGEVVVVHYTASYVQWWRHLSPSSYEGTVFDSSRQRGTPFVFTIGSNRVTPGMNEATEKMKVGGRRVAFVPAKLGYGHLHVGDVPSNSTLIYDIELLEVQGLDERGTWGVYNDSVSRHTDPASPSHAAPHSSSDYYNDYYDAESPTTPDSLDNTTYTDYTEHQYMDDISEMLTNVTARLDVALAAPPGTVATGATWTFNILAGLALGAVVLVGCHWLYVQRKKRDYFQRLRDDYIEKELEMDEL
mmetsp:Transcript_9635/g.18139  ORF Transcript_9635/g.18139 Transcript_9635/m.18139 type:complete len:321 (+) Transcript_9635:301-1263(+)